MYRLNTRFLLVFLGLCTGLAFTASAAPSIRVLGAGNTKGSNTTKVSAVKTGNSLKASNLGSNNLAKKAASVKAVSPKTYATIPVAKAGVNRIGNETEKEAEIKEAKKEIQRFPGIMTKSNIQTGNKISTDTSSSSGSTSGYNIQDMASRLNSAETNIEAKADRTDLNAYYTKEEVEGIRTDYYTKTQIEDRLSAIDTSASSDFIQRLNTKVNQLESDIDNLTAQTGAIYDNTTGEKVNVSFLSVFSANGVLGAEE